MESTNPGEVRDLWQDIRSRTRLDFGEPEKARDTFVKFSRMSARLPSDAMAFTKGNVAVAVSGDHCYVIVDNDDDSIKGPFGIDDVQRIASAVLDADR